MKKICVVTWSGGTNYGTNLQAYALIKKMELMGYDVKLKGSITGHFNYLLHPTFVVERFINKVKYKFQILKQCSAEMDKEKISKFQMFCSQNFPKLNCYGREQWKKIEDEYLAFVTGSDQVWNPYYFQRVMMLDFVRTNRIKKIAYAPSIGVNRIPYRTRIVYKKLLASYYAISVRETRAAELLKEISPVPIRVVLDPTLLLTDKDWDLLIETLELDEEWKISESYILCYFVGNRTDYGNYINMIKKETGLRCVIIPMNIDLASYGTVLSGVGPKEFVYLIKHADIICTDSFHATTLSLIYQKEFYVIKRFDDCSGLSQNGRMYEILDTYGLHNRWIRCGDEFKREGLIDYEKVYAILNEKRKDSEQFLITALEN